MTECTPCSLLQSWTWDNGSAAPLLRSHALLPLKLLEANIKSKFIEMADFLSAGLGTNETKAFKRKGGGIKVILTVCEQDG